MIYQYQSQVPSSCKLDLTDVSKNKLDFKSLSCSQNLLLLNRVSLQINNFKMNLAWTHSNKLRPFKLAMYFLILDLSGKKKLFHLVLQPFEECFCSGWCCTVNENYLEMSKEFLTHLQLMRGGWIHTNNPFSYEIRFIDIN